MTFRNWARDMRTQRGREWAINMEAGQMNQHVYHRARAEHFIRLRLEGMSLEAIGKRFGRTPTTISMVMLAFIHRLNRASRHTQGQGQGQGQWRYIEAWYRTKLVRFKKADKLKFHRWKAAWIIPWLDACLDEPELLELRKNQATSKARRALEAKSTKVKPQLP